VNPEIFRQTINLIYSRHHCLRTIFQLQKNGVFQSFKNGEEAEIKIEAAENCQTEPWREKPFSYEEGPLFRVWLIQGNNHDKIIFNVHHIIIDGWSSGILIKDFNTIYAALSRNEKPELPEIKISFQDYILEKMEQKENQKWLNSENYWKKKFANLPFQFIIPTDYPRPNTVFFPASNYSFHISREEKQLLDNLATTHKTTVFIILISAFKLLIAELSQQSDICAGTVFSNRNQEEYEHIVGPFMNILPLRTIIPEAGNVREILSIVEKTFTEALSHHEYPFSEIVAACRKNQEESFSNPLFQVMFIYQTYHFPELKTGDLCGQYIHTERAYTETDFTFYAEDNKDGGININIEYAENLFKKENIIKWAEVFQEKLKNLLAGKIDKKSVTDHKPEQIQPSLRSQNKEYDILKLIIDSCHKNKKSTAATDPFLKEEISYEELLSQAETTAARLQKMGVRENSIVAIQLPPGLKALTILPAIMMCGAAWLPLDLKSPPKRILEILRRSSADFYIVPAQNDNKNELQITEITTKIITEEELFTPTQNAPKYKTVLNPDKTAYIIYTSGTTGESKGVEISRKALGIFAFNAVKLYNFSAEDRVMQLASWAFDASMEEIFCSLISGANLILMPNHKLNDIKTFLDFVKTNEITVLDLPTAFWHLITKTMEDEKIQLSDSVQKVIIGGEAASSEVWRKWHKMVPNNVKTFNTYGPTEATIVATSFCKREIDSSSPTVPIGKALPHVRTFILDNNRDPVKTGETGELWLGGEGLAKGYLKDKNLTEKMFIMHKQLNMRLYKTGDLVIQTDKGDLIFQGRTDRQIKLRGYRIDCMEVENVIRNHPGVKQNTVGMHNNQLYAFIVAPEKIMPDIAVFLQKELPAYMIPILKNVTEIPLNNSGKIDFKLLCKNIDAEQLSFTEKPETDSIAENIILQIWQRTIDNKSLKSTDDFFECGGNSLLALQLIHQLSLSGFKVNMGDIFLYPTVRKMAENLKINTLKNETSTYPPCIVQMGHSQNDKKKLFLMHSIPGDILGYTELVRELNPEISCYGIQSPGMTNPDMIQADIYKMAAIYADQIISFHKGPLSIAGWCYGGVLAVEVANEFLRRGKAVDFVGVMELGLPETDKLRLQRYLIRNLNILKSGPSAWKRFLKLQNFYKRLFQGKEQRVYALEYDSGFLANRSTIAKANASFLPAYKMKNFPPLINLFFGEPVYKNPQEEWNIFTRTKTHFFSAGHRSILNHPTVKDLAETIKKLILD
jgi:aspartate racemase